MAETQEEKITRLEAKLLKYKEVFAIKDRKIRWLKHRVSILNPLAAAADRAWGSGGDVGMRNLRKQVIAQLRDCIQAHGPITEEWLYSATKRVLRPFIQYFADLVDK